MNAKYDTCAHCNVAMTHASGRGKATKYCGAECLSQARATRSASRVLLTCTVDGCAKLANRVGMGLCESHYMRLRRNDTTELVGCAIPGDLQHSAGYVLKAAPGHPRAIGGYRAYEHRVVFSDAHGEGPFNCHWCQKQVTWSDMHVDHVDADPSNNAIENLVASCPPCNVKRGHRQGMVEWREKVGIELNGVKRTLNEWAALYGINRVSIVARIKRGWSAEDAITRRRGNRGPKTPPGSNPSGHTP